MTAGNYWRTKIKDDPCSPEQGISTLEKTLQSKQDTPSQRNHSHFKVHQRYKSRWLWSRENYHI